MSRGVEESMRPDLLRTPMNRRRFLGAAAATAGAALLRTSPARALNALPSPLPSFVGALDLSKLMSADELWEWENFMVGLGPRFTGSPQHVAYLDFLESECQKAGLTTFHDPTQYFPRWDADYTECTLSILESGGSATDLEVMSYFPGSGNTSGLQGGALVAPVVDAGLGLPEDFAVGIATGSLKGAIAFVTEPVLPVTMNAASTGPNSRNRLRAAADPSQLSALNFLRL